MNYNIIPIDNFKKEAKRLIKKYPSLKTELNELNDELETNPTLGTHLGNEIYKIRIAIASKGKGKRGGARVMTLVKIIDKTIYLFSIYNKGNKDSISDKEIQEILIQEGLL
jgi:hypothetical protein